MWPGPRPIPAEAKFHLDPSNRLATVHEHYRQPDRTDRTDRQIDRHRSDSIGRKVWGRPFVKRFSLCYRFVVCPVCNVGVLWPNGWTDQDETWHAGSPRPWPHCVRWDRPSSPSPKGAQPPDFQPILVGAKWLHGSRCHLVYGGRPRPRRLCVRWGPRSPFPKGGGFGPCLLRPNGWMDEAGTWHVGRP